MKKILPLYLLLSFSCSSFAQQAKDPIDTHKINYQLIVSLFMKQLNGLRQELKKGTLENDPILAQAAKDQAEYMQTTGEVTHSQKVKGKEKPSKRVMFYKGTNGGIGENCLFINIGLPTKTNYTKDTITISSYEQVATALFLSWKNSKGHYQNMINGSYEVSGVGFAYNPDNKRLYATQVFGTRAVSIPKEIIISNDAFGIEESDKKVCVFPENQDWATWKLSNYLDINGDSIFQYYVDLELMKKIFSAPTDAIAVDIVKRGQFTCGTHQLHGSPVFDGMMLQPVYSTQLFKYNQYQKYNELFSFVGKLPGFYNPVDYQLNTILIKGNHTCRYSFPVDVISKNLQLLDLVPIFETTEGLVKQDSFDLMIEHYVPFDRGSTTIESGEITRLLKKINTYKSYIKNISIQTFSSIEGSTEINTRLQEERARNIRTQLLYSVNKIDWKTESKENWDEFYRQIKNTQFSYLQNLDRNSIKEKLKNKQFLDSLDFLLQKQREAIVKIFLKGSYKDILSPEISLIAFKRALQKGDSAQAWIIQSQMIYDWKKGSVLLSEMGNYDVPLQKGFIPVISNIVGTMAYNLSQLLQEDNVQYVKQALQLDSSRFVLKYNYCVYALKRWAWIGDTIENTTQIEKKIISLYKNESQKAVVDKLALNYYVLDAYHCYTHHNLSRVGYCLQKVKQLYPTVNITEEEAINLSKLFNLYYKLPWSMELMYPFVKKENVSEEMLFLFVRTGALHREGLKDEEYYQYLDRAIKMNKERFCKWIDKTDFQLLRTNDFKSRFCSVCAGK